MQRHDVRVATSLAGLRCLAGILQARRVERGNDREREGGELAQHLYFSGDLLQQLQPDCVVARANLINVNYSSTARNAD